MGYLMEKFNKRTGKKKRGRKSRIRIIEKVVEKPIIRQWKKIGVNVLVRASAKGGSGVYLYIPKDHADAYGIISGKKVEIKLIRVQEEIPDEKPKATDLSEIKPAGRPKVKKRGEAKTKPQTT